MKARLCTHVLDHLLCRVPTPSSRSPSLARHTITLSDFGGLRMVAAKDGDVQVSWKRSNLEFHKAPFKALCQDPKEAKMLNFMVVCKSEMDGGLELACRALLKDTKCLPHVHSYHECLSRLTDQRKESTVDELQWSSVEELATGRDCQHQDQLAAAIAVRCAYPDAAHDGVLNDISTTDVFHVADNAAWVVWMEKMAADIFKDRNTQPSWPSRTRETQLTQLAVGPTTCG